MKALKLRDVSISATDKELFRNVNVTIEPGEITTLIGPSGSGKSTLFNWICGYLPAGLRAKGQCLLGDIDLRTRAPYERKVGILFQDPLLFPHMTVGENILFGLSSRVPRAQRRNTMRKHLASIELSDYENRLPMSLSGGQQTRVALIRTLVSAPEALLLDEPFSKLDANLKEKIRNFTFSYINKYRLPTILATHDPSDTPPHSCLFDLGDTRYS